MLGCCFREKGQSATKNKNEDKVEGGTFLESPVYDKSNGAEYYEFLAPSVHHLETTFLQYVQDSGFAGSAKIYDIEDLQKEEPGLIRRKGMEITCPIDGKVGASYVHCINGGKDHIGTATHMLSYTWGYSVEDIVATLKNFCEKRNLDTKRTYCWICCLCNNQHRVKSSGSVSFDHFQTIFHKRVRGIGKVVAMMAPWQDPGYLKRVWCIFEMYVAKSDAQCDIDIVMPPREEESLLASMKKGRDERGSWGIDNLFQVLAHTKVENASASVESDKTNILRLVQEGPGFQELNAEINNSMKKWVKETLIDALEAAEATVTDADDPEELAKRGQVADLIFYVATYFSNIRENDEAMKLYKREVVLIDSAPYHDFDFKVRKATCYGTIGTGHYYLGEYKEALEGFVKSKEMNEEIFGTRHQRTATAMFNIGSAKLELKDFDGALEQFQECVSIYKELYGEEHLYTADAYDNVGRVCQEKKDYERAIECYEKALLTRKTCHGSDMHPSVAISFNNIALLQREKKDPANALETFQQSVKIWESIHGTEHPETATTYYNMGLVYFDLNDFDSSLKMFSKTKAIREKFYGINHTSTITADEMVRFVTETIEKKS